MVLYFDVFRHPLSLAELERLVCPGDRAGLVAACDELEELGLIEATGPYRHRPGMAGFVPRRGERARHAERAWPWARRASLLLARLPFVAGVLVTGGMSKNSTDPDGDIDFLLVSQPGRVWTLKSGLQAGRRVLPSAVRELACTNYLLSSDHLEVDDRNLFTAIELATAIPMWGRQACVSLLAENTWAARFVPGFDWSRQRAACTPLGPRRRSARAIEGIWRGPPAARVEAGALAAWNRYWNRKYDWLDQDTRAQRFKRRPEIATNHLHDFQLYVLREVAERLADAGVHESLSETPLAGLDATD